MKRGRGFAGNAACRFAGVGCQYLLFFATAFLINRAAGSGALGDYMLAVTILNLAGFAATGGLKFGVVRSAARALARGDLSGARATIGSSVAFSLAAGALLVAALWFWAVPLARGFFRSPGLETALKIVAAAVPAFAVMTVLVSGLQAFKEIGKKVFLENIAQPAAALILIGGAFLAGLGFDAVVLAWCVSIPLAAAGAWLLLRPLLASGAGTPAGAFPREGFPGLLGYSLPLLAVGLLYYVFTRIDLIMLGHFRTASEVGVYGLAARLAMLIALPMEAVNAIMEPTVAEIGREDKAALSAIYRASTPWVLYGGVGLFGVLFWGSPAVFSSFGPSFSPGWGILAILGWGQLVNLGVGSAGVLLSMTGHSRVEFYNAAAMVGVNVALNLALIPVYGGAGAALATGVSLAGINLLRLIEVGAILGVGPFSSRYAGTVLCALAAAVGAGVYRACFTELPSPGAALVAVAVFAAVYLLLGSRILLDDRSLAGFNNQLRRLLGRR